MRRMTTLQLLIVVMLAGVLWTLMAIAFGFSFWGALTGGITTSVLLLAVAALYRRMQRGE